MRGEPGQHVRPRLRPTAQDARKRCDDIDMADIDAIPELVEVGKQMAAGIDWTTLLR